MKAVVQMATQLAAFRVDLALAAPREAVQEGGLGLTHPLVDLLHHMRTLQFDARYAVRESVHMTLLGIM